MALQYVRTIPADIAECCNSVLIPFRPLLQSDKFASLVMESETMRMQIPSEIGLKLRAMWAELPNMVVGIFAERD